MEFVDRSFFLLFPAAACFRFGVATRPFQRPLGGDIDTVMAGHAEKSRGSDEEEGVVRDSENSLKI